MSTSSRASARYSAVSVASTRKNRTFSRPTRPDGTAIPVSEYFGCNTFSYDLMAQKIPAADVAILKETRPGSSKLTAELAEKVALAVKEWALAKGATHYCHWFQPQTGATAEKHDAFFAFEKDGSAIEKFSGKQLIQSEPDASSFPSGGRRSTFEARGYTAWDASSPMFLMETENGLTLCIPSVFVSYSGEALDKKTPLLRSISAVSEAAVNTLKLLGDGDAKYVVSTCGPEQEYFVVDRALYGLRPDLQLAGRTLLGLVPPKHQQLEDHYFGAIKTRVLNFILETEYELYKLGVPCKTRHNEVAPAQYEAAPIFEFANVAADHNQLVMEVIKTVAKRHDLVALFNEKPYSDMNGSGKHLNWSLSDSNGNNLFDPGDNPHQNLRFLYFLAATIKAVHDWGGVLRSSVASPGNDFRLGANEAPPAIMSVFLGETLTEVLNRLGSNEPLDAKQREINLDLARVPVVAKDNTDRNRTSPFAFTGNKFEFRAVGSSHNVSLPTTYINTAVANSLREMNERLTSVGGSTPSEAQILQVIQETFDATKKVCFEGNNYSEEWHKEAEKRGLPNLKDTPTALEAVLAPEAKKLFTSLGVYSTEDEIQSRYNVQIERYNKIRLIELETLLDLVSTHVLPAATGYLSKLCSTADSLDEVLGKVPASQKGLIEKVNALTESLITQREKLATLVEKASSANDEATLGKLLATDGMKLMEEAKTTSNALESLVDDDLWSLPKYRELLYQL